MRELEIHEIESVDGADMEFVENVAVGVTAGATVGYILFGPLGAAVGTASALMGSAWVALFRS
ncbi:hypothetical protein FUT69_05705 [Xylella taiwanensis]|uniref:Bacteriocin n=1 Tax=Xylella taiwanensis TaxID=1444770 RepID=Z9JFM3_9GAMM|nr:hypothetical protein [Xylella taiwanensis]AXI83834.1 hypothetical protein AB672_07770 [Xylella taiwanensis]EWS77205.1 hypothetical protein AF72_12100 [Xylella taiwanensis]MCD8456934.1 hypothetical protein [Xylella taiwanensis]MCD8459345.1 hypothetical protein [Xylella taiwanensis]MCD8461784.1 hypothetical protein [Xylella taiwanensis]